MRLPRLYRLLKILRITKIGNVIRSNAIINHFLSKIKISAAVARMFNIFVLVLFINHIMCCFWYFSARLYDFDPDTWVVRRNLLDEDYLTKYITSYYWGFQTFTTIGYGEIYPLTELERVFAIFYMIFGVIFYSSAIGSLSRLLLNMDKRALEHKNLVNNFDDFANKVKMPQFLKQKIVRYLEVNFKENLFTWIQPKELLNILPSYIKKEVVVFSSWNLLEKIHLFKIDINFTISIIPHLKMLSVVNKEIIYREDDPSEESFFNHFLNLFRNFFNFNKYFLYWREV